MTPTALHTTPHGNHALRALAILTAALLPLSPLAAQAACSLPTTVQILGSGGPVSDDARASSGYLVWIDNQPRLLVDSGGGVFLRFGEAKAKFNQLDAIAITHLHADHVGDLMPLLKSGFFSDRKTELPLIGPSGGGAFPGMNEFMQTMLNEKTGAYRYLSGYLKDGPVQLKISEENTAARKPSVAFANERFKLNVIGVTHGPVPALGYLVEGGGKRFAFAGDQNGDNPAFTAMIKDADILVMDHAVPEMTDRVSAALHARPSEIGALAKAAKVKRLVLSHNMARSLGPLQENLAIIKKLYDGPITVAEDLMCLE